MIHVRGPSPYYYYAILTKDSRVRRMICQVVEQDRREFPDVSKKTLGKR